MPLVPQFFPDFFVNVVLLINVKATACPACPSSYVGYFRLEQAMKGLKSGEINPKDHCKRCAFLPPGAALQALLELQQLVDASRRSLFHCLFPSPGDLKTSCDTLTCFFWTPSNCTFATWCWRASNFWSWEWEFACHHALQNHLQDYSESFKNKHLSRTSFENKNVDSRPGHMPGVAVVVLDLGLDIFGKYMVKCMPACSQRKHRSYIVIDSPAKVFVKVISEHWQLLCNGQPPRQWCNGWAQPEKSSNLRTVYVEFLEESQS